MWSRLAIKMTCSCQLWHAIKAGSLHFLETPLVVSPAPLILLPGNDSELLPTKDVRAS